MHMEIYTSTRNGQNCLFEYVKVVFTCALHLLPGGKIGWIRPYRFHHPGLPSEGPHDNSCHQGITNSPAQAEIAAKCSIGQHHLE